MVDWNDPQPFEIRTLHEALLFAFYTPQHFNAFLQMYLGRSYDQLVPFGASYQNGLLAVLLEARSQGWLPELVKKARRDKPSSPKLLLLDRNLGLISPDGEETVGRSLEDIVHTDGQFAELIPWIEKLGKLGSQTCRIEYPVNLARGSGWLVGPDLVLTNWHVINKLLPGGELTASEAVCRFDYMVTAAGIQPGTEVRLATEWCVDFSPASASETGQGTEEPNPDLLDYALIRLATQVGAERGWVKLHGNEQLPNENSIVSVLQYPDGHPLKLSLGDVTGRSADRLRFFHTANTRGGSSGSLVLDAACDPVGLHHAGDLLYHTGKIGAPERNQAVPIGLVASRLKKGRHL